MTTKQFKRTQIEVAADYKTLKAPQAVIVLKAIDELQTFDLKQLDEKCIELGLVTNSKRGVRMVADWYRRIFKEDGLVVEIKVEKPAKSEPRNKKQANQIQDTNNIVPIQECLDEAAKKFAKSKAKKNNKKSK